MTTLPPPLWPTIARICWGVSRLGNTEADVADYIRDIGVRLDGRLINDPEERPIIRRVRVLKIEDIEIELKPRRTL